MKILFLSISSYGSGYWHAACGYLRAMQAAGLDVVFRHVNLNNSEPDYSDFKELMDKSEDGCNICIQHTLPSLFCFDGRFDECIGLFAWETDRISPAWAKACNAMSRVFVINNLQYGACLSSGVKVPIGIIPHACDINKYFKEYGGENSYIKELKNLPSFKFYTIGEFTKRKNLGALVKAFHLEFEPAEPVDLVIKSSKEGISSGECFHRVSTFCNEIKEGLKLYGANLTQYKKELIITDKMSENDLMALHQECDCFVQPSYGEAFSLPAFDAMCFGKIPIVTKNAGYEYIEDGVTGYLIESYSEPVFSVLDTTPDIYSGRENWKQVDISNLRKLMRLAYITKEDTWKQFHQKSSVSASKHSYNSIGQLIKYHLCQNAKSTSS